MDATVIEEIANQLGMAVDTAAQFIADILPQYAGLQMLQNTIWLSVATIAIIACIAVFAAYRKLANKRAENDTSYTEWERRNDIQVCAFACGVIGFFAIAGFFACLYGALGWHLFPEAMLLDMALERVA